MLISSYGPLASNEIFLECLIGFYIILKLQPKIMMHTAKNMHQILSLSNDAYEEIFQEIDTTGLVEKGIIYIWTNKNLKSEN